MITRQLKCFLVRNGGYRDNCELSDRGEWEFVDYDFDRDVDWDYWSVGGGGGGIGSCLDGKLCENLKHN